MKKKRERECVVEEEERESVWLKKKRERECVVEEEERERVCG